MDGTGALFTPLLRQFSQGTQVQVITYPPREPLGYSELVRLVVAALPKDGDYVLLGESFSGPVALGVAAHSPARLCGLILACSFASAPLPALAPLRHVLGLLPRAQFVLAPLGLLLMGRYTSPALRQALAATLAGVDPLVLRRRASAVLTVDATASLAALRCPVLYLQAIEDRVVPAACAAQVQRLCAQAQVVRLAGPHFLLQTQPALAAAAIESFMRRAQ